MMTSPAIASLADSVSASTVIHEPRDLDILCGKETKARNHKGSRCFRIFVDRYRKRYQEANNKHKRGEITKEMYLTISQANIRFLKFSDERNGWVEISSTEARDKITHALRFAQKRSSRKSKKNAPQRTGSDSTHRSETSATTATSYDWDQLLMQQQQHLASLSLGNMNASLRASRSSFSSVGSASVLSKDLSRDSSHSSAPNTATSVRKRASSHHPKSKVSFADPSICSSGLPTIYSNSAAIAPESIPLPVDLSSTQKFDMHASQSNLDVEQTDRPPRMPSRPTEEDEQQEAGDDANNNINNQTEDDGFDTIMDTTNTGFDLLDPLLELDQENMRDSDSHSSGSVESVQRRRRPPPTPTMMIGNDTINSDPPQMVTVDVRQPMVAPNGRLLRQTDDLTLLEPIRISPAMIHTAANENALLDAVDENWLLIAVGGDMAAMNLNGRGGPTLAASAATNHPMDGGLITNSMGEAFGSGRGLAAGRLPPFTLHEEATVGEIGEYVQLMKEPLWEMEPMGNRPKW